MVINGKMEIIGEFLEFEKTPGLQVNCSPSHNKVNTIVLTIETKAPPVGSGAPNGSSWACLGSVDSWPNVPIMFLW